MEFVLRNRKGTNEEITGQNILKEVFSFKAMWERISLIENAETNEWLKSFMAFGEKNTTKDGIADAIVQIGKKSGYSGDVDKNGQPSDYFKQFINQMNGGCNFYTLHEKEIKELIDGIELTPYVMKLLHLFLLIHIYGGINFGEKDPDNKKDDGITWNGCKDIEGRTSVELMRFLLEKAEIEDMKKARYKKATMDKGALCIKALEPRGKVRKTFILDDNNKRTVFPDERLYVIVKNGKIVDFLPRAAVSGFNMATATKDGLLIKNAKSKEEQRIAFDDLNENEEIASWCFDDEEEYIIAVTTQNRVLTKGLEIGKCEGVMACCYGTRFAVLTPSGTLLGNYYKEKLEDCITANVGLNAAAAIDFKQNVLRVHDNIVTEEEGKDAVYASVYEDKMLTSQSGEVRKHFAGDRVVYFENNKIMLDEECVREADCEIEEMIVSEKMAIYRTGKSPEWTHVLWKD